MRSYTRTNYSMVMLRLLNYAPDKFIRKLLRLHSLGMMEYYDIHYITRRSGFLFIWDSPRITYMIENIISPQNYTRS